MKKFIIQNAIVNINNEKINILILENKEKLEKYILYLVNNTNEEINSTNKFEKFEFKDNINITPKKKLTDSKIEVFYNSSTKKHSLLLNKKQIYFTLNPHITLYNENIIINDNFKLIKADSTLYNHSGIIHSFVDPTTFSKFSEPVSEQALLGPAENDLISKILNDNKNKIEENIELKNLINNTGEHSIVNEVTCNLQEPNVSLTNPYSGFDNIVEDQSDKSIQVIHEESEFSEEIVKSEELVENTVEKEVSIENIIEIEKEEEKEGEKEGEKEEVSIKNIVEIGIIQSYVAPTTFGKSSGSTSGQALMGLAENEVEKEEVSMENIVEIENEGKKEEEVSMENTVEIKKKEVSVEDSGIIRSFVAPDSSGSASDQSLLGPAEIKIINLNSKIIPNNSEILLPDCKEIKIIEKNFEEDKEIKNIEILKMDDVENKLKMDNVENKLKNIFDLDKIMIDFNNLFNDLSNEETELEVEMKSELSKNKNISSKKVHFSEQNTMGNIRSFVNPNDGIICDEGTNNYSGFRESNLKLLERQSNFDKSRESTSEQSILSPTKVNKDIMNINIPHANNTLNEIKKNNDLLYNKVVNYQNVNYKIPTIRILPTQNLNFSNLYTSQIHENNILLNLNLSIELGKDNLSYLIKIANQKYLINKTNNSIVLTNLFNKNSQIIKNKDNFKIGMLDNILYNDCTLLMQVTNQKYFDNSNGRTISFYTPKI